IPSHSPGIKGRTELQPYIEAQMTREGNTPPSDDITKDRTTTPQSSNQAHGDPASSASGRDRERLTDGIDGAFELRSTEDGEPEVSKSKMDQVADQLLTGISHTGWDLTANDGETAGGDGLVNQGARVAPESLRPRAHEKGAATKTEDPPPLRPRAQVAKT